MDESAFPEAQRIVYLVSRYIDGAINFAELQELDSWKRENERHQILFDELLDRERQKRALEKMQAYDSQGSLQKIKLEMAASNVNRDSRSLWLKITIAAIVLLAIVLFALFLSKKSTIPDIVKTKPKPTHISPGSDKAILTLSNGKRIAINAESSGVIASQAGMQVRNIKGGKLTYVASGETKNNMTEYNSIETPRGGKYAIKLPDGTEVWLNAASSLRYPTSFHGNTREVTLSGEGYFEVAKDKSKPFIVHAPSQTVTVLGTHFNINAYHDEPQVITTLVEGSVHITSGAQEGYLHPGQQSLLSNGALKIEKADVYSAIAWKNGQLAFLRTDIKAVLRQVARWYDIEIEYRGAAPAFTISGDVSREADLSAMLEILKLYNVQFNQQGRKLIILDHKAPR